MSPVYKESSFPLTYRQAEVGQVLAALSRLRSIAVTGLAGMGKSNVVRFIASHAAARRLYLRDRATSTAIVHVDCAALPAGDEADTLGELLHQLRREWPLAGLPAEPGAALRHSLRDHILGLDADLTLAVLLDDFDQAAAELGRPFFNYLCHLRNSRPRANLCYVFATRRPLGHLFELQELLDDGCIVGPMGAADALASLRRDEARLGYSFDAAQCRSLLACSGGHPGLLKNAAELVASGRLDLGLPLPELGRQMLASFKIEVLCRELWDDLTPPEQAAATRVACDLPLPAADPAFAFLRRYGLLAEPPLALFSPAFQAFVADRATGRGPVRLVAVFPNQARIEAAAGHEQLELPPRVFALLHALAAAAGRLVPTADLIDQVYGAEAPGVSNAALSQLVKRLRGLVDPPARRLANDPDYTCVETVRDVGYRLTA